MGDHPCPRCVLQQEDEFPVITTGERYGPRGDTDVLLAVLYQGEIELFSVPYPIIIHYMEVHGAYTPEMARFITHVLGGEVVSITQVPLGTQPTMVGYLSLEEIPEDAPPVERSVWQAVDEAIKRAGDLDPELSHQVSRGFDDTGFADL